MSAQGISAIYFLD
jgi:AP-1 complex subunit mu